MPMMHIGHVRVSMHHAPVRVRVRVLPFGHRLVHVIVMRIVMPVRVLVLDHLVRVLVLVSLRHVQHEPQRHHRASRHRVRPCRLSERPRHERATERRRCEHRRGATRAERALRLQVEP